MERLLPTPLAPSLDASVANARALSGREAGAQVDGLFAQLACSPPASAAEFLLRALEAGAFRGLRDGAGQDARARAVEALLELGFPHALHVHPEDLRYLRAARRRAAVAPWVVAGVASVLALPFTLDAPWLGLLAAGAAGAAAWRWRQR